MPRRRLRLRRWGGHSLVDLGSTADPDNSDHEMTVQERLNELGFGSYQVLLLVGVGVTLLAECLEMGAVAPLHTAMSRFYSLSRWDRMALPMVTGAGSVVGLLVSGPICDWRGRIPSLAFSLVTIACVMLTTAVLPPSTSPFVLLIFRFFSGFAAAIQVPAGLVLAVESCPEDRRPSLVFGIQIVGNFGYFIEAVGVQVFMPQFGEAETDAWRSFCLFIGMVALISLPMALALKESPSFLAMKGDVAGCVGVLDHIAHMNGRRPLKENARVARQEIPHRGICDVADVFRNLDGWHLSLLVVLSAADMIRGFFVSGSSYLWKDLFQLSRGARLSPSTMNIISSVTPLIGLMVSQRLLWLGVRRVAFVSAVLAALAMLRLLFSLASQAEAAVVELEPWIVLICIMIAKLTYGPLGACISLMKAESFPTEIRASAYAFISVIAKVSSIVAPTLIEVLKGSEAAESWPILRLCWYVLLLAIAALVCGLLMCCVPGQGGDGQRLHDFLEKKALPKSSHSDPVLVSEAFDTESEGEVDQAQERPRLFSRCNSVPVLRRHSGLEGMHPATEYSSATRQIV